MFLFILSLLPVAASAASDIRFWGHKQKVVPAQHRLGNRYYIEVDNIGNDPIFKPIAIHIDGSGVAFGDFKESSDCVIFGTTRTILTKCKHQFFLLSANHQYYERRMLYEAMREKACDYFKVRHYVLVLIKANVEDPKSEKYAGTYSTKSDSVYYTDKNGERKSFKRVLPQIKKQELSKAMFEVLCVGKYSE
ncbi:unnamed protein product [Cylicocyclus nassatus]|uniref:Uncharacterized protein n=1 Tax=Cylicocyclus nassatus TaxID=53992 RepID=A0AA36M260_CYLNA|nr:unnamed protein product [Cylicocyclus nassatus]